MSSMQDTKRILSEHKVIPDVLPEQVTLSYNLTLKWPSATLDTPGKHLHREETQDEPQIFLDPAPTEELNNLVLICTDPDLMMNDDTYFGQVRHWLYTNISTDQDGSLNFANVAKRSPWVGPAPLPNYVYPRPHRYVFILASSTNKVEVTPEDLRELQKPYVTAMAGKQGHVQDIKDRWGFNAYQLIENKGLKVEAVNFMSVGGTLKSAAANAAMVGQGMVDKVLGN